MSLGKCRPAAVLSAALSVGAVLALFAGVPASAEGQEAGSGAGQRIVVVNPVETARSLIARGDYRAAATILDALENADPKVLAVIDPQDIAFLRGLIAFGEERFDKAASIFEAILAQDPSLPRVRLELGRVYFALREDDGAVRQFELAIAGDIGNTAINNAEAFLRRIDDRKVLRTRFSFALAPDSNVNQATSGDTVDIFGLPFALNDDAREKSGLGLFASAGIELRPRLAARVRGSAGLQLQHTEFEGSAFDDTIASGWVGPEISFGDKYLTLAATGFRRWYGHQGFNSGVGGRASLFVRPGRRWRLSGQIRVQAIDYDLNPARDGIVLGIQISPTYTLDTKSQFSAVVGFNRDFADGAVWRSTALKVGLGYYRELPWALTADIRSDVSWRTFDTMQIAFGREREDKTFELGMRVIKRDIRIFGLSPMVGYTLQRNISNIGLYDFTRHRAQIGLTKRF